MMSKFEEDLLAMNLKNKLEEDLDKIDTSIKETKELIISMQDEISELRNNIKNLAEQLKKGETNET